MDMKLYCFYVGAIKPPMIKVPMPMYVYLIEHPKGLVLIDTGESYENRDENAIIEKEDTIIPKLAQLGYKPDDIDYVVISHMHQDHVGYMEDFPNATFIVRKEELKSAWWPEVGDFGYDFVNYANTRGFKYIQLPDDVDYDIFMDGTIVLIDTRGHSRGHQSVVLDLPNTGKTVLTIDAAPEKIMLDRGFAGRPCYDGWQWVESLRKLKHLADCGYKMLYAHDADNTPEKIAPEYYD